MRCMFPGYYRPTEEEFSELWECCLFVLDANVLLRVYEYPQQARSALVDTLKRLSDRLWVPYQVALEYQKNRLSAINKQLGVRNELVKNLGAAKDGVIRFLGESEVTKKIETFFSELIEELKQCGAEHDSLIADDKLRDVLSSLLEGKIGPSYTPEKLEEIYAQGKQRYTRKTPPGYKDEQEKDETGRYGDLVLWFQIVDKAQQAKKPVIFVTDDNKEDWWRQENGKTIGPRPELVEEMLSKTGQRFYMYSASRFLERAAEYLQRQVDKRAVEQARNIAERSRTLSSMPIYGLSPVIDFSSIVDDYRKTMAAAVDMSSVRDDYRKIMAAAVDMSSVWDDFRKNMVAAMDLSHIFRDWAANTLSLQYILDTYSQLSLPASDLLGEGGDLKGSDEVNGGGSTEPESPEKDGDSEVKTDDADVS